MSLLRKIVHQAEKTFATNVGNKDLMKSNILILKKLIDQLQFSDLLIDPFFVSKRSFERKNKAPCTFVSILEREKFTLTVFILNSRYTMPLHDHPRMVGMLKCVSGKLKVQSYTRINNSASDLLVTQEEQKIIDEQSPSTYLDESDSNYHEISALDEPAAFFDVLSPPYMDFNDQGSEARQCHFYKKLIVDNDPERRILKLEQIDCPSHYYCDSIYFEKPDFMLEKL